MSERHTDREPVPASWRASAGYLYILDLAPPALAWEYLRRNPEYRVAWGSGHHSLPNRWGLRYHREP